jgi:hypothetical protein
MLASSAAVHVRPSGITGVSFNERDGSHQIGGRGLSPGSLDEERVQVNRSNVDFYPLRQRDANSSKSTPYFESRRWPSLNYTLDQRFDLPGAQWIRVRQLRMGGCGNSLLEWNFHDGCHRIRLAERSGYTPRCRSVEECQSSGTESVKRSTSCDGRGSNDESGSRGPLRVTDEALPLRAAPV